MSEYELVARTLTADEHRRLMASVGWQHHIADEVREASLRATLHSVVIEHDGDAVGMARLVGDGVHYFYVQDLVVHPDHSDQGLGPRLLRAVLDWVDGLEVPDPFVGLFSSDEAIDLYSDAGFVTTNMTGMHRE